MIDNNCTWLIETNTLISKHAKVEQTELIGFVTSTSGLRIQKHIRFDQYSLIVIHHRSLIFIIDHAYLSSHYIPDSCAKTYYPVRKHSRSLRENTLDSYAKTRQILSLIIDRYHRPWSIPLIPIPDQWHYRNPISVMHHYFDDLGQQNCHRGVWNMGSRNGEQ